MPTASLVGTVTRNHGTFVWRDAAGSHAITWGPGEGNMTIDGICPNQREALPVMDRGNFSELVDGDYVPVTVSITVRHTGPLTSAVAPTLLDSATQKGVYASDTTADPGGVSWAGDARYTATRNGVSCGWDFYNGAPTVTYAEAKEGNTISLTAIFHGKPDNSLLPLVPF